MNIVSLGRLFPALILLIMSIAFALIFLFMLEEKNMQFKKKIKILKNTVNVVLICFVLSYLIAGLLAIVAFTRLSIYGMNSNTAVMLLLIASPQVFYLVLYYKIYKEYRILINNFEQGCIFEDENTKAFKQIAHLMLLLLVVKLAISVLGLIFIHLLANFNFNSMMGMSVNVNYNFDISIVYFFILVLIINIFACVFEKAVAVHKENSLTI